MASTITAGNATNGLALSCDNTGILELKTGTGAGTTAITADASQNVTFAGNVGIGTSSLPSGSRLAVVGGGIQLSGGTSAQEGIRFQRISGAATLTGINNDNNAYNALAFFTGASEAARIDSSGNFLVNTTSGVGAARFVVEQNTLTANPMAVSNPRSTAATDYAIMFYRNGSLVGSIQTSLSATSYVTSSDYRLKENVRPMVGALAKVTALKPCTYTWKSDGTSGQGFIAHELAEVVPDAVTGEKDAVNEDGSIKPQGIDTSFLVATLTAAIQEQQQMIEELKAEVAALKGAA